MSPGSWSRSTGSATSTGSALAPTRCTSSPPPHAAELLPFADRICQAGSLNGEVWANLAGHTEAAWVGRALAGDWPTWARHGGEVLELVCRPNLDLHTGVAGWYRERHGNLRTDDPSAVLALQRAQPTGALPGR